MKVENNFHYFFILFLFIVKLKVSYFQKSRKLKWD